MGAIYSTLATVYSFRAMPYGSDYFEITETFIAHAPIIVIANTQLQVSPLEPSGPSTLTTPDKSTKNDEHDNPHLPSE